MHRLRKRRKRLVSWSTYITCKSKQIVLTLLGWVAYLCGILGLTASSVAILSVVIFILTGRDVFGDLGDSYPHGMHLDDFFAASVGGLAVSYLYANVGNKVIRRVRRLETVLPPTRKNIDLLSARDVLVRGASEPREAARGILLRSAFAENEPHAEELLRSM